MTDCVLYIFLSFGGYGGYAGNDHEFLMYPPRILPSAGTAGTPISHHEFSYKSGLNEKNEHNICRIWVNNTPKNRKNKLLAAMCP